MHDRVPAQAAIEQVLQAGVRPRTPLERALGRSPLDVEARPTYRGAIAERAVAAALAGLPASWTVLHSLPAGRHGADIDHLVAGPGGILIVTAQIAGIRRSALARAASDARRVERLLDDALPEAPAVRTVVAVVGPERADRADRRDGVQVVALDRLRDHLLALPERCSPAELAAVVARLGAPSSWQPAATAGPELLVRFGELQREVAAAERVRALWLAGGAAAAAAAAVLAAVGDLPH